MSHNLSSGAVVIGALRVNYDLPFAHLFFYFFTLIIKKNIVRPILIKAVSSIEK